MSIFQNIVKTSYHNFLFLIFGSLIMSAHFTALRGSNIGLIEVGIMIVSFIIYVKFIILERKRIHFIFFLPPLFILIFLFPITLVNTYQEFYGSSFTTIVALLFSSTVTACIYFFNSNQKIFFGIGISIITIFALAGIVASGKLFETIFRFSYLSDNPNQIAIYSVSGVCLVTLLIQSNILRMFFLPPAIAYGILSLSDALFLSFLSGLLTYLALFLIKKSLFIPSVFFALMVSIIFLLTLPTMDIQLLILDLWREADEGGSRIRLFINGLDAYLDSPAFGHGGGGFSGFFVPFDRFEAHNTFVDLLTIGGPILVLIFYLPLFIGMFCLYKDNQLLGAAMIISVIIFSLFHFVARHPIVWIIVFFCLSFSLEFLKNNVRYIRPSS